MISHVDRGPSPTPGSRPGPAARSRATWRRASSSSLSSCRRVSSAQRPRARICRARILASRQRPAGLVLDGVAWAAPGALRSRRCRATARTASRRSARIVSPVSRTSEWAATWVPLIFIPPSVNGGGVSTSGPHRGQGECQLQTAEKEGEAGAGVGAGHHPVGVSRQSGEARERPIGSGRRARTSCSGGGTGRRSSRGAPPPPAGCRPRPRARCAAGPSRRPAPSGRRCPGWARSW